MILGDLFLTAVRVEPAREFGPNGGGTSRLRSFPNVQQVGVVFAGIARRCSLQGG